MPGEPAAAFAQMLLVRLAIVLGTARKALRCQVTRGSRAGRGFRDCRQQFTVNSSPQRSSEQARRQGYSPFFLLLWAKLKYSDSTILLSFGPAAAAAEQTAWRGVNAPLGGGAQRSKAKGG